ncbi:MAG: gliding motility-associated C-terminal domain-containing protein [Bacteroidales bacterium]|nr:gliding motility-associated C-terminal domain-containing protein [Bacteroidales bacterium]
MLLSCFNVALYAQDDKPEKPKIIYTSIDSVSGLTIIHWQASSTPDIQAYNIYNVDTTTYPVTGILLGTVPGDSLYYSHSGGENANYIYTITALKSGNESLLSGDYHKPVELSIAYDSCLSTLTLEWEPYIGWGSKLAGYRIYEKIENNDFSIIYEVNTKNTEIVRYNIEENKTYQYVIEAFDNQNTTSTSNREVYFTYMPAPPSFVNIDFVTILDDNTAEISVTADVSGKIRDFRLTKARSTEANFTPVHTLYDVDEPTFVFYDDIFTQGNYFYYRVEALNSCSQPVATSNFGNNILLRGQLDENNSDIVHLQWNPYVGFYGGIGEYRIYRQNEYGEFDLISSIRQETVAFSENIAPIGQQNMEGEIRYYIEAIEADVNPYGVRGVSKSNQIRVQVETDIILPNAFTPNGDDLNERFAPIIDFKPKDYKMFIFDRSGKMLFYSVNPLEGWDGSVNGKSRAPEGIYVYHIEFMSYNGVRKVRTGNVVLIIP